MVQVWYMQAQTEIKEKFPKGLMASKQPPTHISMHPLMEMRKG